MSYCRMSKDSDVYVYGTHDGYNCCACFFCKTAEEMLEHLNDHRSRGDKAPQYAIDRLKEEIVGVEK